MAYKHDVIDLADDEDDEAEYDSIPLPDDIEAIENAAGPSRRRSSEGRKGSMEGAQDGIDARQSLKAELAKIDAEVSTDTHAKTDPVCSFRASSARLLFSRRSATT